MLRWEHADALVGPFSADALAYARQPATATDRFPDTRRTPGPAVGRLGRAETAS
ncbi:hypothetical protein [Frankia sp. Cj3]|uniref:hypothetical protein n=1 Tax=Frankia sp. Cj3 TaxID=2880976 RepID=UPI001EF4E86E|nr:hypothetical protein [Frankia sp. Cj3]